MYTYCITCSQRIWCFVQVLEEESYAEARTRPLALTKPIGAVSTSVINSSAAAVSFDRSTSDTTTSASARPHPATLLKQLSI